MGLREWAASLRALGAVAYRSWEAYVGYLALALYLASVVYGSDVERSTTGKRVLSTLQPWAGTATVVLGFIAVVHAYHVLRVRLVPCLVMTFGTGHPYSQEVLADIAGHQAPMQLYRVGLGNIGAGTIRNVRVYLEAIDPGGGGYLPAQLRLMNDQSAVMPAIDVPPSGDSPVRFVDVVGHPMSGPYVDHVAWRYGFGGASNLHRLPQEAVTILLRAEGDTPRQCFMRLRVTLPATGRFMCEQVGECGYSAVGVVAEPPPGTDPWAVALAGEFLLIAALLAWWLCR